MLIKILLVVAFVGGALFLSLCHFSGRKRALITTLFLLFVLGGLSGVKVLQISTLKAQGAHMTQPPEIVSAAPVTSEQWRSTLTAVASLSAVEGVTVAAQLDGTVARIGFEAGSRVKAGDILVEQDTAAERAQLRAAEAGVELARLNLERSRELLAKQTIAQSQYDADEAAWKQAVASADTNRALIEKKTIRAPFSGRLGVRLVNLGQFLKAGDPIVSLQALDPIYADFYLPQRDVPSLSEGLRVLLTSDAFPGDPVEGRVTTVSPDLDATTRNVRVEATIANPGERLRPGMYADAAVELPEADTVLVVPATAVQYASYGSTVFVVESSKDPATGETSQVVRQQVVRLGETRGDFVAVTSGLKAGETVVTSGVFRLRDGGAVQIDNTLAPDAKQAPKPSDS